MSCCLHLTGKNMCQISENIAVNKTAYQSSTLMYNSEVYPASRAVDGNITPILSLSCSHNHNKNYAWWIVDLERNYDIAAVAITKRKDLGSQYSKYVKLVSDISVYWYNIIGKK